MHSSSKEIKEIIKNKLNIITYNTKLITINNHLGTKKTLYYFYYKN